MRLRWAVLLMAVVGASHADAGGEAAGSWTIRVTTSGGFTGRGRGGVRVSSEGKLEAGKTAFPGTVPRSCEYQLSAEELTGIAASVAASKPDGWGAAGQKGAAPDAFGYRLELRQGERTHDATWYDNTRESLPADLKQLYDGVAAAWKRALAACEGARDR